MTAFGVLWRGGVLLTGLLALVIAGALVGPVSSAAFGGLALLFGVCSGLLVRHWAAAAVAGVAIGLAIVVGLAMGMDLDGVTRAAPSALAAVPLAGLIGSLWGRQPEEAAFVLVREQVALLNHAIAAAGVGVCALDAAGEIVGPDDTFCMLVSGWASPQDWWKVVMADTPLPPAEPCGVCGGNTRRFGRIVDIKEPRGARRAFEISAVGHVHYDDEAIDVLLVADVSARRERESVLAASGSEVMTERRMANALLEDLGRDIRTPLAAILGYSELLREQSSEGDAPAGLIEDLDRIHTAGQQLEAVVSDLVELREAPPSGDRLMPERFDLRELVDALVPSCERLARTGQNRFEVRLAARVGEIVSDPARVRQVIVNLVSAGCRATERGTVTLSIWREGDRIVTVVSDTGHSSTPSVPPTSRIEGPTFTDGWSTGATGAGPSLGDAQLASVELAVARRVAQLLGGDVIVRSRSDGNTVMATFAAALISASDR